MKIRIRSGALRYRLTRSEVALFQREGVIKEKVQIGDDQLIYVLQRTAEARLSATFKNNIINLLVPEQMADEWTGTDKVGISGEDRSLHLLIEKDFTCLDNVEEDQSDNYPNPLALKDHE
ncbi:hypothetical protein A0256_17340 [Mucilaginibacter sp. PAMC 26640]|nr:hypothetical protein A0256_17340 [Mucilaginibacter sp. PAMC 26640]